jgi:hypothetical protein
MRLPATPNAGQHGLHRNTRGRHTRRPRRLRGAPGRPRRGRCRSSCRRRSDLRRVVPRLQRQQEDAVGAVRGQGERPDRRGGGRYLREHLRGIIRGVSPARVGSDLDLARVVRTVRTGCARNPVTPKPASAGPIPGQGPSPAGCRRPQTRRSGCCPRCPPARASKGSSAAWDPRCPSHRPRRGRRPSTSPRPRAARSRIPGARSREEGAVRASGRPARTPPSARSRWPPRPRSGRSPSPCSSRRHGAARIVDRDRGLREEAADPKVRPAPARRRG